MTTTCEHGVERATCAECGVLAKAAAPKSLRTAFEAAADFEHEQAKVEALVGSPAEIASAKKLMAEMAMGDDPTPEQLAQFMREHGDPSSEWLYRNQLVARDKARAEGKMRPLTDVEEKWARMKHADMPKAELDALIAEGLPADVVPITRADLPKEITEPHAFTSTVWDHRKKKRKISAANRARNRRVKKSRGRHAKKRSA